MLQGCKDGEDTSDVASTSIGHSRCSKTSNSRKTPAFDAAKTISDSERLMRWDRELFIHSTGGRLVESSHRSAEIHGYHSMHRARRRFETRIKT